ncbi:hypothetical protein ACIG53_20300 [Streptomyces bauhiniae]|uniref:hypothetical protein n=1 Tax=Streptomyces bauhiniae TaxID=2340725 RepID=UPI0037CDBAB9
MFGENRLSSFQIGDAVTVGWPRDRPIYHQGSHGTVVSLGTKRVHVRMDKATFEDRDGSVESFLPGDLKSGHAGTPRNVDRMKAAVDSMKLEVAAEVVAVALDAGVVTVEQGNQIKAAWANHVQN